MPFNLSAIDFSFIGIPYIFVAFVIFCAVCAHLRRKANRQEEKNRDDLMVAENLANQVRAVDLDSINYLSVPLSLLPFGAGKDTSSAELIADCESKVNALAETKLLNLNSMTNTEIKQAYGAANLDKLSACDDRFSELIITLNVWGQLLKDEGLNKEAVQVLAFAVSAGSDIKKSYLNLGDLYFAAGQFDKIDELIASAEALDSLNKTAILTALRSY